MTDVQRFDFDQVSYLAEGNEIVITAAIVCASVALVALISNRLIPWNVFSRYLELLRDIASFAGLVSVIIFTAFVMIPLFLDYEKVMTANISDLVNKDYGVEVIEVGNSSEIGRRSLQYEAFNGLEPKDRLIIDINSIETVCWYYVERNNGKQKYFVLCNGEKTPLEDQVALP